MSITKLLADLGFVPSFEGMDVRRLWVGVDDSTLTSARANSDTLLGQLGQLLNGTITHSGGRAIVTAHDGAYASFLKKQVLASLAAGSEIPKPEPNVDAEAARCIAALKANLNMLQNHLPNPAPSSGMDMELNPGQTFLLGMLKALPDQFYKAVEDNGHVEVSDIPSNQTLLEGLPPHLFLTFMRQSQDFAEKFAAAGGPQIQAARLRFGVPNAYDHEPPKNNAGIHYRLAIDDFYSELNCGLEMLRADGSIFAVAPIEIPLRETAAPAFLGSATLPLRGPFLPIEMAYSGGPHGVSDPGVLEVNPLIQPLEDVLGADLRNSGQRHLIAVFGDSALTAVQPGVQVVSKSNETLQLGLKTQIVNQVLIHDYQLHPSGGSLLIQPRSLQRCVLETNGQDYWDTVFKNWERAHISGDVASFTNSLPAPTPEYKIWMNWVPLFIAENSYASSLPKNSFQFHFQPFAWKTLSLLDIPLFSDRTLRYQWEGSIPASVWNFEDSSIQQGGMTKARTFLTKLGWVNFPNGAASGHHMLLQTNPSVSARVLPVPSDNSIYRPLKVDYEFYLSMHKGAKLDDYLSFLKNQWKAGRVEITTEWKLTVLDTSDLGASFIIQDQPLMDTSRIVKAADMSDGDILLMRRLLSPTD